MHRLDDQRLIAKLMADLARARELLASTEAQVASLIEARDEALSKYALASERAALLVGERDAAAKRECVVRAEERERCAKTVAGILGAVLSAGIAAEIRGLK